MTCNCCKKQKASLSPVKSQHMPGVKHLLCDGCKKHTPRHVLVIAARSKGYATVKANILKRQYCGTEILAEEILT